MSVNYDRPHNVFSSRFYVMPAYTECCRSFGKVYSKCVVLVLYLASDYQQKLYCCIRWKCIISSLYYAASTLELNWWQQLEVSQFATWFAFGLFLEVANGGGEGQGRNVMTWMHVLFLCVHGLLAHFTVMVLNHEASSINKDPFITGNYNTKIAT